MARSKVNQAEGVSTYDNLLSRAFCPEQVGKVRKVITVSERGVKYILDFSTGHFSVVFRIDGDIIKRGKRCDRLILAQKGEDENSWLEVFVELKGTDIQHAIEQLRETIKKKIFCHSTNKRLLARVVAKSFPSNKSNLFLEKAKIEFISNYSCDLRTIKSLQHEAITF